LHVADELLPPCAELAVSRVLHVGGGTVVGVDGRPAGPLAGRVFHQLLGHHKAAVLENAEHEEQGNRDDDGCFDQRGRRPAGARGSDSHNSSREVQPLGIDGSTTRAWSFIEYQSAADTSVCTFVIRFANSHLTLLNGSVTVTRR